MSTMKTLVQTYNDYAKELGLKAVTRFATTKDGERRLAALRAKAGTTAPKAKPTKAAKAAKGKSANQAGRTPTVASRCMDLIRDGLDNAAIWAIVSKEFKLADEKRHYPGWYRNHMKRKGIK